MLPVKQNTPDSLLTHTEYFDLEEQAETKSEYQHGHLVAMTGASIDHNRIVGNLHHALYATFKSDQCEVFMGDLRLYIEAKNMFTYPNLQVICGPPEFMADRTDTVINPILIIEVLSKSTAGYDHTDKFHAYWRLPTLREYIMVDQYRRQVECFRRTEAQRWELRIFNQVDDGLSLASVGVEIPLAVIYRGVVLDTEV